MCLSNLNFIPTHNSPFHTNCLCFHSAFSLISSFLLLFIRNWLFVIWVFAQDYKVLHHRSLAEVLLRGKLSSFLLADQDRGVVSLETGDLLGLSGCTDSVDSITDSDLSLDWLQVFVELKIKIWLLKGLTLTVMSMRG